MTLIVTPLYAAVLALIYIALAVRIIRVRRGARISLGWSGNSDLQQRVRIHGNFAEYVPFALLLLMMAELRGAGSLWLHLLGCWLIVARLAHAYALSQDVPKGLRWRAFAVISTFGVMLGAVGLILITA